MNDTEQVEFRNTLEKQRRQILGRVRERPVTGGLVGADGVPDFADYAIEKAAVEVSDHIAESEANLLAKIDLALQRIEDGTYDRCAECGGTIPVARLRAKPAASLCVECQAKKERAS